METNKIYEHSVLSQPISRLPLSDKLKLVASIHGFKMLNDLLEYPTFEIERLSGFNIQLVHEYMGLLENHELGHLIDSY